MTQVLAAAVATVYKTKKRVLESRDVTREHGEIYVIFVPSGLSMNESPKNDSQAHCDPLVRRTSQNSRPWPS